MRQDDTIFGIFGPIAYTHMSDFPKCIKSSLIVEYIIIDSSDKLLTFVCQ